MATQNLPFLIDRFTAHLIEFIDHQLAAQPAMKLSGCSFESPESCSGVPDGGRPCQFARAAIKKAEQEADRG